MVARTRKQARGFLFGNLSQERRYSREEHLEREAPEESHEECDECSQRSSSNDFMDFSNAYEPDDHANNGSSDMYRPNDRCRRHRKPDNEPYTETVVGYKRRKKS